MLMRRPAFAEPSTLAEAPGVCALWLVPAPALACPGVTEALPEVELPAAVCAPAERVIKHIEKLAITAILQWFFIVSSNSFSLSYFYELF